MAIKANINIRELSEKGKKIYEEELKPDFEIKYPNKYVAIEVKSGKYYLGDKFMDAIHKARKDFPEEVFYTVRVGSPSTFIIPSNAPIGTTIR